MIPHNRLTWGEEEVRAVSDVVRSGQWAAGPQVECLEADLAERAGRAHAIACSSGFSALQLAMMSLEVEAGHEVIIPAYTCVALPNAVRSLGAVPIQVDVLDAEWTVDPIAAARACTPRTKAIIAVHTFGLPARIKEIQALTSLPVIEDCSHGFAVPKEDPMGGRADLAICSFYATKLIGGGEGGAILFNDLARLDQLDRFRDCTDRKESGRNRNMKMSDVTAAIICTQLTRLDAMVCRRRELATHYLAGLQSNAERNGWRLPLDRQDRIWYRFSMACRGASDLRHVQARLAENGIRAERPVDDWRVETSHHPVSNMAYDQILSLPIYPSLQDDHMEHIQRVLAGVYEA